MCVAAAASGWSQLMCTLWGQALGRALPAGLAPLHFPVLTDFPPSPTSMCHPIWSQLLALIHHQLLCCWQRRKSPAFTEFSGVMTKGIPVDPDCKRNRTYIFLVKILGLKWTTVFRKTSLLSWPWLKDLEKTLGQLLWCLKKFHIPLLFLS